MRTIEIVREAVRVSLLDGQEVTDMQPLFYDAAVTNADAARTAGGAGLDSLDRVEIYMELEDKLKISIPDDSDSFRQANTISAIAALVDSVKESSDV